MIVSQRKGLRYVAAGVWVDDAERQLYLLPAECRPGGGVDIVPVEGVKHLAECLYRQMFPDPLAVGVEVEEVYGLGPVGVDRGA